MNPHLLDEEEDALLGTWPARSPVLDSTPRWRRLTYRQHDDPACPHTSTWMGWVRLVERPAPELPDDDGRTVLTIFGPVGVLAVQARHPIFGTWHPMPWSVQEV